MKILVLTLVSLSALVSCKKSYNCECTTNKTFGHYEENGAVHDFYYQESTNRTIKDKKEDAKSSCIKDSKTYYEPGPYAQNGQDPTLVITTCVIK